MLYEMTGGIGVEKATGQVKVITPWVYSENQNHPLSHASRLKHPRCCIAILKRKGGRKCLHWAEPNSRYCKYHNGARPHINWKKLGMPTFYSKRLGPTLAKAVLELSAKPLNEQAAMYEELALMRAAAGEAVKLASAALESPVADESMRAAAVGIILNAMNQVTLVIERLAKIEANAQDKLSLRSIDAFIVQMTAIMAEVLGEEHEEMAAVITDRIKSEIRVPLDGLRGTKNEVFKAGVQVNIMAPAPESVG